MTDYNDGNWHGWNGGECPVHSLSVVEYVWLDLSLEKAGLMRGNEARHAAWSQVVRFRVVDPYVEPEVRTGECWAFPSFNNNPPVFFSDVSDVLGVNYAKGRFTETRINGKPTRIVWEADE